MSLGRGVMTTYEASAIVLCGKASSERVLASRDRISFYSPSKILLHHPNDQPIYSIVPKVALWLMPVLRFRRWLAVVLEHVSLRLGED